MSGIWNAMGVQQKILKRIICCDLYIPYLTYIFRKKIKSVN